MNEYLEKIEKSLKPLPASERVDIVQEIKSEMLELQAAGKSEAEILQRLGDRRALAKAYLGDLIVKEKPLSWTRVLALCAYYSLAGLSGLIVIPTLGICAPVFLLCAVICPVVGALKLLDSVLNLGLPWMQQVGVFVLEGVELAPGLEFIACVLAGVLLGLAGWGCWKLLVLYIRGVSKVGTSLSC